MDARRPITPAFSENAVALPDIPRRSDSGLISSDIEISAAGRVAHQGNSRAWQCDEARAARDMVVRPFVPKELVQGVIDNSISTELGGIREEITVVFTDVRDFTMIAESADPDLLMHQTSRYFSVLTEAFLAEGGTVDKFIGDAVMVFWNAPTGLAGGSRARRKNSRACCAQPFEQSGIDKD
jgi:class 3 adenylate cyclase